LEHNHEVLLFPVSQADRYHIEIDQSRRIRFPRVFPISVSILDPQVPFADNCIFLPGPDNRVS